MKNDGLTIRKKNYPDLFFCSVEADSIIKVIRLLCMSIGIDLDI